MPQSRKKKKYATMTNTNEKTLLAPILGTQVTHRIEPHKFIVNASETVYVPSMAKSKFKNGNLRKNFGSGTTGCAGQALSLVRLMGGKDPIVVQWDTYP